MGIDVKDITEQPRQLKFPCSGAGTEKRQLALARNLLLATLGLFLLETLLARLFSVYR